MPPIASLVGYLDRHQGASTAILTAVLVLVTVYYAIQNRRMVKEMELARASAIRPDLALDFHRLAAAVVTLAIRNAGPGAAHDIDVRVVWESIASADPIERRWRRNVLGPGEQADLIPPGAGGLSGNIDSVPATYKSIRLLGTMKDAAGIEHEISATFDDLAQWRDALGDAHERFVDGNPERRAADALSTSFAMPLRNLNRSVDRIAEAVARLASPQEPADERE